MSGSVGLHVNVIQNVGFPCLAIRAIPSSVNAHQCGKLKRSGALVIAFVFVCILVVVVVVVPSLTDEVSLV